MFVSSCNQEDSIKPIGLSVNVGSDTVSTVNAGWAIDKTHSNVNWSTLYYGDNAFLTGKFNSFDIAIDFIQENIEASKISAYVVLSTFNTGEAGRDAYGKCGPGYMGVVFDTASTSPVKLIPRASTDTAWFESTSIKTLGNGYVAAGNLKFRGVTKEVTMPFNYYGIHSYTSSTGAVTLRAGFKGEFKILAQSDFGISSTSIADEVAITVNGNFRKNL
jgi:polyisoprenoid-binding protein YceI